MYTNKSEKKYFGVLRRLAKLDSFILNQLKVVVCDGEFNEVNEQFFTAPLMILDQDKNLSNQNSNRTLTGKNIDNYTEQIEVSSENKIKVFDNYPDSSDLSEDE